MAKRHVQQSLKVIQKRCSVCGRGMRWEAVRNRCVRAGTNRIVQDGLWVCTNAECGGDDVNNEK